MAPKLQSIDHIHIYVVNRELSEAWYKQVLGLHREKNLEFWAADGGPLTITNDANSIHLALFQSDINSRTVVAFSASGEEYLKWYAHLKSEGLQVKHTDHNVSWSIYFKDLDNDPYEITTYDYEFVKQAMANN